MFQLLATLIFAFALIAPLAVVILSFHNNWNKIVGALMGAQPAQATVSEVRTGLRSRDGGAKGGYRLVIRPAVQVRAPLRAAA